MLRLTISIVTYAPDLAVLARTLASLQEALVQADLLNGHELWLIDNGPGAHWLPALQDCLAQWPGRYYVRSGQGNVGYGRGHNLALWATEAPLHLVLNPDVELAPDALQQALAFMQLRPEISLLTPAIFTASGQRQYLCRRYPAVWDFFLRGFAPAWLKHRFAARLARLELQAECQAQIYWDPPLVSGCFMLVSRRAIRATHGFSPLFPLYFEDYDWSLRLAQVGRIVYVPQVRIVHHGGGAARKGLRHIGLFLYSAQQFYRRHGWKIW